jgi:hypothetical protein
MKTDGEAGLTILEVLLAICVISCCLLITAGLTRTSRDTLGRVKNMLLLNAELLRAGRMIRKTAGAVAIPYWEQKPDITETPSIIRIPWYQARAEQTLEFRITQGDLVLQIGPGTEIYTLLRRVDDLTIKLIPENAAVPGGILIGCRVYGRACQIKARFAGSGGLRGGIVTGVKP